MIFNTMNNQPTNFNQNKHWNNHKNQGYPKNTNYSGNSYNSQHTTNKPFFGKPYNQNQQTHQQSQSSNQKQSYFKAQNQQQMNSSFWNNNPISQKQNFNQQQQQQSTQFNQNTGSTSSGLFNTQQQNKPLFPVSNQVQTNMFNTFPMFNSTPKQQGGLFNTTTQQQSIFNTSTKQAQPGSIFGQGTKTSGSSGNLFGNQYQSSSIFNTQQSSQQTQSQNLFGNQTNTNVNSTKPSGIIPSSQPVGILAQINGSKPSGIFDKQIIGSSSIWANSNSANTANITQQVVHNQPTQAPASSLFSNLKSSSSGSIFQSQTQSSSPLLSNITSSKSIFDQKSTNTTTSNQSQSVPQKQNSIFSCLNSPSSFWNGSSTGSTQLATQQSAQQTSQQASQQLEGCFDMSLFLGEIPEFRPQNVSIGLSLPYNTFQKDGEFDGFSRPQSINEQFAKNLKFYSKEEQEALIYDGLDDSFVPHQVDYLVFDSQNTTSESMTETKCLPKTEQFTISPSMHDLRLMSDEQLSQVQGFSIHNKHAKVVFHGPVDLRNADLDAVFVLSDKSIEINSERNIANQLAFKQPAELIFFNWVMPEKYAENYEKYLAKLEGWVNSFGGTFVDYSPESETLYAFVENV